MKKQTNNYIKAVDAVLNHFKSPLAAIQNLSRLISDLDISLELKSNWGERAITSTSDIKWYLASIQDAFCEIGQLSAAKREKGIEKALEWFVEHGNSEAVYQSLKSALVRHCLYSTDYGVFDFNKNLRDIGAFITFATILHEEDKKLQALKKTTVESN